ncbi:RNA 2',3'-cyclic phosphodiesterase [Dehalococcoidia bacterium]|nr:RNA 2',3'-cyclic phosphodiesterase [Dehalococcoidia bacterium]
MNETLRAFLAIDLPASLQSTLTEITGQLRHQNLQSIRPVNPNSLHLTLKFMDNVPANKIPEIVKAVSGIIRLTTSFDLKIGPIVIFPNERFPRTISVGFKGNLSPIIDMHRRVETNMACLGIIKEQRPFIPHITLARMRGDASSNVCRSAIRLANQYWTGSDFDFQVNSVSLIKSILSSNGAIYDAIANFETKDMNRI